MAVSAAECLSEIDDSSRRDSILKVNLAGLGVITAWGVSQWDYFSTSPHAESEGWFERDTGYGGADKLGHLYASYLTSHSLSALYKHLCFSHHDAAGYGALSSFIILGYMELGDAYSEYGFSREDLWMNSLGSLAGYYLYDNRSLAAKIDLRWEYGFNPSGYDFVTDYENVKFLMALKLDGFEKTAASLLKYFEIHLGYYTRGYDSLQLEDERNAYLGFAINLSHILRSQGYRKSAVVFNYYQLPGAYLAYEKNLNR